MFINNLRLFVQNIYKNKSIYEINQILSEKLDPNDNIYKVSMIPKLDYNETTNDNENINSDMEFKYFAITVSDTALQIREITESKELEFIDTLLSEQQQKGPIV